MRILVAGIGNIFLGDDGFGSEVARRLSRTELPVGVDVVDFGIRGMDLGYALTEGYDAAILVDTVSRGGPAGTVYVVEPELDAVAAGVTEVAPHDMDPVKVLRFAAALGGCPGRVLIVGCQPESLGGDDGCLGLSPAVETAVDEAVRQVRTIARSLAQAGSPPGEFLQHQHRSEQAPGGSK